MKPLKFKVLTILLVVAIANLLQAQEPAGYYNGTDGLTGDALRSALHNIIDDHNSISYAALWTAYKDTDKKSDGTVWDIYTNNCNFTFVTDQCGTYSNICDCYNREHTVPQSWFGESSPMVSDIFHVLPTDGKVNGMRSNYPYGVCPSGTVYGTGKLGTCTYPGYSGTVFEPADEYKGDIARIYFYMATRYMDILSGWGSGASSHFSGNNLNSWTTSMLLDWHNSDPVSDKEKNRNNIIYTKYQNNRNPYVDHPEWVCVVWGGSCGGAYFTSSPVTNATIGTEYIYNITYIGATATLSCSGNPAWMTFTNLSAGSAKLQGTPTTSNVGSYNIILTLTDSKSTITQSFTVVVPEPSTLQTIFNKDFDDQTLNSGGWSTYSVKGEQAWNIPTTSYGHNGTKCSYISGYNGTANVENEDWLISPAVNLDNYKEEVLTFWNAGKFTGDNLKLFYSKNYSGTGDPSTATWTEITGFTLSMGDWEWLSSGNIDLSAITGNNIYFGFKYISSATAARSWELDDIKLEAKLQNSIYQIDKITDNTLKVYPNPFNNELNIDYVLQGDSKVIIEIFDITGKKVQEIVNENQKAGEYNFKWNSQNMQKGIYILKLSTDNQNIYKKLFNK